MDTKDELYKEFLKNFPNFEPMVRTYYMNGSNAIKIYTKQGKHFIFEKNDNGIVLKGD